jgi:GNAT superfamily N-acetyltransferase
MPGDQPMSRVIASQPNASAHADNLVRPTSEAELDHLARLWYDGWHETHAPILPADLAMLRTLETFRERLQHGLADLRVVGPEGAPTGFCLIRGPELYQLFVSPASRGAGVAAALIEDAETRLRQQGVVTAHLGCAIGNDRAARFYEKRGWSCVGTVVDRLETASGPYLLEVWRYEKRLV